MRKSFKFVLPIISAFLLIFAYPKFNLEFLGWVALVPLFFALQNKNIKQRFIIGYIFGVVFFSGILYWLTNVTWPGMIVLVLLLSLAPAIFCLFYSSSFVLRPSSFVFVPSAWVLTEYLRAHLLSGFPWALLGYSQSYNLSVIQIADITGTYGVSFLVILINFGIYLALKKAPKRFYILFFIFLLFMLVFAYGQIRITQLYPVQRLRVALIQGNISQEMKWDEQYKSFVIDKQKRFTEESAKENPHLIIWPETAVSGYLEEETDLKREITDLAKSVKAHILVGTLREEGSKVFNSATLVSNKGEILKSYDKIHLVPFGEFVPFEGVFSWVRNFVDEPIADFDSGREFTVFDFEVQNIIRTPDSIQRTTEFYKFSTLICFEDIFPDLCRDFVRKGAKFLVNITNDVWFGKTASPYQHAQGSIFRAVENRVPVVRAANTGLSCIIDHRGKVLETVKAGDEEIFVDGYVVGIITPGCLRTFYTRFGDVFSWICIAIVVIGLIVQLKMKSKSLLLLILVSILACPFVACAEGEAHYEGKFKFAFPFGKKYDYDSIRVKKVIDGDTIELENGERVRLIGIDTPEAWYSSKLERDAKRTGRDYETIIAMGEKSTKFTRSLVEGKRVRLEFDVERMDRYGRLLAYVYLPDGRMLNAELVKEGYAQIYTFPPNVKYVDLFLKLQSEAREQNKGLWKP